MKLDVLYSGNIEDAEYGTVLVEGDGVKWVVGETDLEARVLCRKYSGSNDAYYSSREEYLLIRQLCLAEQSNKANEREEK